MSEIPVSSTLDSFFKRLGQGQGRIWGGRAPVPAPNPPQLSPKTEEPAPATPVTSSPISPSSDRSRAAPALVKQQSDAPDTDRLTSSAAAPWLSPQHGRQASQGHVTDLQQSVVAASVAGVTSSPPPPSTHKSAVQGARPRSNSSSSSSSNAALSFRESKYDQLLALDVVNLTDLRTLSWNGIPVRYRPLVWKLLSGYMPTNRDRREQTVQRKRREYEEAVAQYFQVADAARTSQEQSLLRQILVDIPRTAPEAQLFRSEEVKRSMTRVLYVWAVRHPASGYVQGINDLLTPLYLVFLGDHVGGGVDARIDGVSATALREVEADAYWCLTKLLDNIQDHYTAAQPGLQRMVLRLEELIRRIDADLHAHMTSEGLQFIQFAFRWMNCLLMRELPLTAIIRAWDTYLSEEGGGTGFEGFHVYVCAALLCRFSPQLLPLDFASMVMFLQDLPTKGWGESDVEPLLSQAYILSTLFENSSAHLNNT